MFLWYSNRLLKKQQRKKQKQFYEKQKKKKNTETKPQFIILRTNTITIRKQQQFPVLGRKQIVYQPQSLNKKFNISQLIFLRALPYI